MDPSRNAPPALPAPVRRGVVVRTALVLALILACHACSVPAIGMAPGAASSSARPTIETLPHATLPEQHEKPDALGTAIITAIATLSSHGLEPEDYGLAHLKSLASQGTLTEQDLKDAWRLAAAHLAHGRLDPQTLRPRLSATPAEADVFTSLEGEPAALAAALDQFAPRHPSYQLLRAELARERAAMALETDPGIITNHAANIDKLRINLERWRWIPHDLGRRYILANIAAFNVATFENDAAVSEFSAIFGRLDRETPTFSDEIEYLVFNPWWEVPPSIARNAGRNLPPRIKNEILYLVGKGRRFAIKPSEDGRELGDGCIVFEGSDIESGDIGKNVPAPEIMRDPAPAFEIDAQLVDVGGVVGDYAGIGLQRHRCALPREFGPQQLVRGMTRRKLVKRGGKRCRLTLQTCKHVRFRRCGR